MNLPNFLSFLRIFSVPLLIWLMMEGYATAAFWLFGLAGLTDALDGFIAKRFHMETELGRYLDPLADKLLLLAGFVILTVFDLLPLWLTLLVVTRDVVIVGGALVYQVMTGMLQIRPLWISKLNTVSQMLLLLLVLWRAAWDEAGLWVEPFVWLTAVTTLISGGSYVFEWSRMAAQQERIKGL
ncbi:MAG: CDP-alcohol phosphatidyltransferase family protein [Magnetococcales bacterium]|nr:CDP-alcohol phosphatidyltransferase family protein [Magnetococcales bacterium]